MHNPSKIKCTTETLDSKSLFEKYDCKITPSLEVKFATYEIKDIPCQLLNAVGYSMKDLILTKRFDEIEIETNDRRVLVNHVAKRLALIKLDSSSKTGNVSLEIHHNKEIPNPINIYCTDLKLELSGSFLCDRAPIAVIAPGCYMKINARIAENSVVASDINHRMICNFDREQLEVTDEKHKEFEKCDSIETEYNHGKVLVQYQDSMSGEELLITAVKSLKDYYAKLEMDYQNIADHNVSGVMIPLPNDPATVLASTLAFYIYSVSKKYDKIVAEKTDASSQIRIDLGRTDSEKLFKKGIEQLQSHLDML
ncbi:MAG: hypothetical protein CMM93_01765 [Rickettsiales bacterium]|nr:hypothetical protein [Rickettsiales bacterium]|tara:strand:- start:1269 stop:2198 length:930 start_codon:yes stop_codon:yes gene_type:complete